jgi:hypothetical protein
MPRPDAFDQLLRECVASAPTIAHGGMESSETIVFGRIRFQRGSDWKID